VKTELILLAAGQSNRFGGIKQLTDIHGQPMICHCLAQYRHGDSWAEGLTEGHVALGANANLIIDVLPKDVNKHILCSWQKGMGQVLADSMRVIANDTTHVLIGLADQVLITQKMVTQMLDESNHYPQNIIAAKYASRLGAPSIFPRRYFLQLSQLKGDNGAKTILQQASEQVISIDMPEAAFDIDTPEDIKCVDIRT
jgi:molybdenum cofactor cytidylyltransferase